MCILLFCRDNDELGAEVANLRQAGAQDTSLKNRLEQLVAENRQLNNELSATRADKSYLYDELQQSQARVANLTAELDERGHVSGDIQRRLDALTAEKNREIEILRQRLESSSYGTSSKWDAERRAIEESHKERLAAMREEIQALRSEKAAQDATIQRLSRGQSQYQEPSLDEVHFAVVNLLKSQHMLSQNESSATVDRSRMVRLLADLKGSVTSQSTQVDSLRREADKERNLRIQLERETAELLTDKSRMQTKIGQGPSTAELAHLISEELATRLNIDRGQSVKDVATDKLCQMLLDQAAQLRKELESAESKSAHWQQVAQSASSVSDRSSYLSVGEQLEQSAIFQRLRDENSMIKDQLLAAKAEASVARSELRERQNTSQIEFASLWLAVQELNKLDSEKESMIARLKDEKSELEKDREELAKRLKDMSRRYQQVWDELHVSYIVVPNTKNIF